MQRLESASKIKAFCKEFPWLEEFLEDALNNEDLPHALVSVKIERADEVLLTRMRLKGCEHFLPRPHKTAAMLRALSSNARDEYRSFLIHVKHTVEGLYLVGHGGHVWARVGWIPVEKLVGFIRRETEIAFEECGDDTVDLALNRLGISMSRIQFVVSIRPVFNESEGTEAIGCDVTIYKPPHKLDFASWRSSRVAAETTSLQKVLAEIDT